DGHAVWSLTRSGLRAGAASVSKGLAQLLFSGPRDSTDPGRQLAVDARTGAVLWEVPVPNSRYGFYSPPGVAGGPVVTCAEHSVTPAQLTARSVTTGDVVWQATPAHCTDVAISRGVAYTGWMGRFDLATGAELSSFVPDPAPLITGAGSPPAIGGKAVY